MRKQMGGERRELLQFAFLRSWGEQRVEADFKTSTPPCGALFLAKILALLTTYLLKILKSLSPAQTSQLSSKLICRTA